jgi:CheY-like chemotaxis protein
MWAESVPQKGSTFHFTLPLKAVADAPPLLLQGPELQMAGLRLLIVDDNPTNRRILTLQTTKWGMIPRDTPTATQALEWMRAGERFDLALLDMRMPGMDGLMLAGEIRKLPSGSRLPLVLLTSVGVRSDSPEFASAELAGFLTKPIKPFQLREILLRVMSGSKPAASSAPAASTKLDPTLATRLPLRVLLCDDNVVNQKVAARLLKQMGYRSDIAANGLEALAALDRQPYDLIFMDVMMPEMGGFEATQAIRERQKQPAQFPNCKSSIIIVAMTASAMQGDREKCLAAGMDDYLAKPVRLEDVRAIVEKWGPAAGKTVETTAAPTGTQDMPVANPLPQASSTATPAEEEAPVEMERLLDFTNGDPESLRELVTLYLEQTTTQIEQLSAAVQAGDAAEVRRVAHSCAGASATCGMRRLVPLLRELERQGYEQKLTSAAELSRQVGNEFECIRVFLEAQLAHQPTLAAKS